MASNVNNPVWDIYDELRTARLNIEYFQEKIRGLNRSNAFFEIVIEARPPLATRVKKRRADKSCLSHLKKGLRCCGC